MASHWMPCRRAALGLRIRALHTGAPKSLGSSGRPGRPSVDVHDPLGDQHGGASDIHATSTPVHGHKDVRSAGRALPRTQRLPAPQAVHPERTRDRVRAASGGVLVNASPGGEEAQQQVTAAGRACEGAGLELCMPRATTSLCVKARRTLHPL